MEKTQWSTIIGYVVIEKKRPIKYKQMQQISTEKLKD